MTDHQLTILNQVIDLCIDNKIFPLGFLSFKDLNQQFGTNLTDQHYKEIFEDYWHDGVEAVEEASLQNIGYHAEDRAYPNPITY